MRPFRRHLSHDWLDVPGVTCRNRLANSRLPMTGIIIRQLLLARFGIRVVAAVPARADTPVLRQWEALRLWENSRGHQRRDEFTRPPEIAEIFAFLASHEANCINGSNGYAEDDSLNFKYDLKPQG
jgi:hypothetical protein